MTNTTHSEIVEDIKMLYVDCPECRNIEDDQYGCTTCWWQGGQGRVNVFQFLQENPKLLAEDK